MIKVTDNGAARVLRVTNQRGKSFVTVGVLGREGSKPAGKGSPITVAQVAEWAEFGIGQPERSWLRGWVDSNEGLIFDRIERETRAVLQGKRTQAQALKRIGVWLQGEVQLNIANFPDNGLEPNAPSTIERKGSSVPLINTGQLRSSITHKVHD